MCEVADSDEQKSGTRQGCSLSTYLLDKLRIQKVKPKRKMTVGYTTHMRKWERHTKYLSVLQRK